MTAIAEATQLALLPPLPPAMKGVNIAARYRSATREASVGGDLYEIIPTGHGIRGIIGDVRGKGLEAVQLAGRMLSEFRRSAYAMPTIEQVARELGKRKLAFIAAREHVGPDSIGPDLKKAFGGVFVANEAIDQAVGQQLLDEGKADAVAFGKLFIANPDLPARFAKDAELNRPNAATFYAPGAEGYTDYPALEG